MAARRRYSDDDRANALAALAANAGDLSRTARQLKLPRKTLEGWARHRTPAPPADLRREKKAGLADRMEEIARQLLAAVTPEKIGAAGVQALLVSAGVAVDKMRLLRNQPTENVAALVIIEEIRGADDQPHGPATPGPGGVPPQ